MTTQTAEFAQYVQALLAATTPAEVGAVYLQMVGYDSHLEDPTATLEALRLDALDYVREWCFETNTPVGAVGLVLPQYLFEHRDFPRMPEADALLALGWTDASWHNNTCPRFVSPDRTLQVWMEHPDRSHREAADEPRFCVKTNDDNAPENEEVLLQTEDWSAVQSLLALRALGADGNDDEIVERAVQAGLDAACLVIQNALGVTTGDFAGVFFSGSGDEPFRTLLAQYLTAERDQQEADRG